LGNFCDCIEKRAPNLLGTFLYVEKGQLRFSELLLEGHRLMSETDVCRSNENAAEGNLQQIAYLVPLAVSVILDGSEKCGQTIFRDWQTCGIRELKE